MEDTKTGRAMVLDYVKKTYHVEPDYPWMKAPDNAVIRHKDTRKWFGILMPAPKAYLGTGKDGYEDVLTIKSEPLLIDSLVLEEGYYRAYHMNKAQWMSVRLDGTVAKERIWDLLDMSYKLTDRKEKSAPD